MCARCPDLPFLPGFTFNPMVFGFLKIFHYIKYLDLLTCSTHLTFTFKIGKTRFPMDPKFDFIGPGVRCLKEKVKPNMLGPLTDKYPSIYARGEVTEIPAWIAFDKQVRIVSSNHFSI